MRSVRLLFVLLLCCVNLVLADDTGVKLITG
jgi:hypothetical protein